MTAVSAWPDQVFDAKRRPSRILLVGAEGSHHVMNTARWHGFVTEADREVLDRTEGPVLDVGCGPGRHAAELRRLGRPVLGLDSSEAAARTARRRGAPVHVGSVFDDVPGCGHWGTILLLDGNVGIGGEPHRLLQRCADLLRSNGKVLIETEPPGRRGGTSRVRVEMPDYHSGPRRQDQPLSPWFHWATVSASQIGHLAVAAGLTPPDIWVSGSRWFAEVRKPVLTGRVEGRRVD